MSIMLFKVFTEIRCISAIASYSFSSPFFPEQSSRVHCGLSPCKTAHFHLLPIIVHGIDKICGFANRVSRVGKVLAHPPGTQKHIIKRRKKKHWHTNYMGHKIDPKFAPFS